MEGVIRREANHDSAFGAHKIDFGSFKIDHSNFKCIGTHVSVGSKRNEATSGLWSLLTLVHPNKNVVTGVDNQVHKILSQSHAHAVNHHPKGRIQAKKEENTKLYFENFYIAAKYFLGRC
jgi:hypothetical protein